MSQYRRHHACRMSGRQNLLSEDSFSGAGLRGTIIYVNPSLFGIIIHIEKVQDKNRGCQGQERFQSRILSVSQGIVVLAIWRM